MKTSILLVFLYLVYSNIILSQVAIDTNFMLEYSKILSIDVYPSNVAKADICGTLQNRNAKVYHIDRANLNLVEVSDDLDECKYIIAFSLRLRRFYKLAGFRNSDIQDFSSDLTAGEKSMLYAESLNYETSPSILYTVNCLLEYTELPKRKRSRKSPPCKYDCDKTIQLQSGEG